MSFLDFLIPTAYAPDEEMAKELDIENNRNLGSSCLECNQSNTDTSDSTNAVIPDNYSDIKLNYFYDDDTPVENIFYKVELHNSTIFNGALTDGVAVISDVEPGSYDVTYEGASEKTMQELRNELNNALTDMVKEVRHKAQIMEKLLEDYNYFDKGLIYTGAFIEGLYLQAQSVVEGLGDLVSWTADSLFDVGAACWRILGYIATGDLVALRDEFEQILANTTQALGTLAQAFETLWLITTDPQSRHILAQFPGDYFDAHSSVEKTRMAGQVAFEILLALATYGASVAVSALAKSPAFVRATKHWLN